MWVVVVAAVAAVSSAFAFLSWLAYLRLVKHVIDRHGADAVKDALPQAARAFPRPGPIRFFIGCSGSNNDQGGEAGSGSSERFDAVVEGSVGCGDRCGKQPAEGQCIDGLGCLGLVDRDERELRTCSCRDRQGLG